MGADNATRLSAAKITSLDELLQAAYQKASREKLSTETAIHPALLLHWARCAELAKVSNLGDLAHIVWLDAAGISSLADLTAWENEELELIEKLKTAKEKRSLDIKLPDKTEVAWWIKDAKRIQTIIEV